MPTLGRFVWTTCSVLTNWENQFIQKFTKMTPMIPLISMGPFLWFFGRTNFPSTFLKETDFRPILKLCEIREPPWRILVFHKVLFFFQVSTMLPIIQFFIEGICTGLLGIFGILGNVVAIMTLSSTELDMMPSFRHLLKMMAAFDATFLVFTLGIFCVSAWSDHYNEFIKPWLIPYFLPIIQV